MTRLNDRLLVQQVDEVLVIIDESTGAEVVVPLSDVPRLIVALHYFNDTGQDF